MLARLCTYYASVNTPALSAFVLLAAVVTASPAFADRPLPALHDGLTVSGGTYRHDGPLHVQGRVTLRNLTLELHGPIEVAEGARFELDGVTLNVADPPSSQNGVSGLRCIGPAQILVRNSTMQPIGTAHPMWGIRGTVTVHNFSTTNSEFHLDHAQAQLDGLKIFELEISHESRVTGNGLDLVFLSTHSSDDDRLSFADIPVDRRFSQKLSLGSGASADLHDAQVQIFLLYIHGAAKASLANLDRVQLALFPRCNGTLTLPHGRIGSAATPVNFPDQRASDCPFQLQLKNVNVDTWDVYAGGKADLTFQDSLIDELVADGDAQIRVKNSDLYADWFVVGGRARVTVENSTVGALRLASQRPDLATSEIHVNGNGFARFSSVRFDCGVVAGDHATVEIERPSARPAYVRTSGNAKVHSPDSQHPARP